ncbi:MAG: hypothetical protein B6229_05715 [Spirochaetaceae bacterium 4572_7]|nr:MAG: hypothetical protein B6229_05715 [Spirochaetaceae bacterium 4572_7]
MNSSEDSEWISFSDIMTGLMIVFLFISISYMQQVKKEQQQKDEIFEKYQSIKTSIYNDLSKSFSSGFEQWKMEIEPDLSIKITDASALFEAQLVTDDVRLKSEFKIFLGQFTPIFFEIILNPLYADKIAEVRIEGHTGISAASYEFENDYYQNMIVLSQKRSNKVLEYMMSLDSYAELSDEQKNRLRFFMTSNGLAYGKALDGNGEYKFYSKKVINEIKSMRVEFKIVTNSADVIDRWVERSKK